MCVARVGPQDAVQVARGHRVHRHCAEEPEREAAPEALEGSIEGGVGGGQDQAGAAGREEGPGEAVSGTRHTCGSGYGLHALSCESSCCKWLRWILVDVLRPQGPGGRWFGLLYCMAGGMLDYIVSILAQVAPWLCSPMVKSTKYTCVDQPGKPLILFISKLNDVRRTGEFGSRVFRQILSVSRSSPRPPLRRTSTARLGQTFVVPATLCGCVNLSECRNCSHEPRRLAHVSAYDA